MNRSKPFPQPHVPVTVSGVHDLELQGVSHVISIRDARQPPPRVVLDSEAEVLVLHFSDPGAQVPARDLPSVEHLQAVRAFIEEELDMLERVHVHCQFGISRSTAVALMVMHLLNPDVPEEALVGHLHQIRSQADPSRHLLEMVDQMENTRFVEALEKHRRNAGY